MIASLYNWKMECVTCEMMCGAKTKVYRFEMGAIIRKSKAVTQLRARTQFGADTEKTKYLKESSILKNKKFQ